MELSTEKLVAIGILSSFAICIVCLWMKPWCRGIKFALLSLFDSHSDENNRNPPVIFVSTQENLPPSHNYSLMASRQPTHELKRLINHDLDSETDDDDEMLDNYEPAVIRSNSVAAGGKSNVAAQNTLGNRHSCSAPLLDKE